jgi:hypothetical protein
MNTIPGRRIAALATLALVAAVGCDEDSVVGPESLAGIYQLISVNGANVPAEIFEDSGEFGTITLTLVSGSLVITPTDAESGTYEATLIIEQDLNGAVTTADEGGSGPYTISGNTLTLDPDDEPTTAVVSGNQITLTLDDVDLGAVVLVLRK